MAKGAGRGNFYRRVLLTAVRAVVILAFAAVAAAASLEDYQSRLAAAHAEVESLLELDPATAGISVVQKDKAGLIRRELPPQMEVDWRGGTSVVDNTWLHTELDSYAAESDPSKQGLILERIDGRITAIESAAAEAAAAVASEHSKDQDKNKLAEILSRQEYQKPPEESESIFQKLRRQVIEWLSKMFPSVDIGPREPVAGLGSLTTVLQVLLYAALAAGILYLLYKFVPYFTGRFGREEAVPRNERVILGERVGADMSSTDLFAEAERLARDGDLRMAIRKGYVALLCELSDRKLIGLARHKTNRDYLKDLRPRSDLFENVRGLTGSFERHWYGSAASAEKDWDEFRALYRETIGKA